MDEIAYTYSMILSELFILCGDINDAVIVKKRTLMKFTVIIVGLYG